MDDLPEAAFDTNGAALILHPDVVRSLEPETAVNLLTAYNRLSAANVMHRDYRECAPARRPPTRARHSPDDGR